MMDRVEFAHDSEFMIGFRTISNDSQTYFIADIGANHDGSLDRAKELIKLAKDAGADCAKFQHFKAKDIVSAEGFKDLKTAHQAKWDKSVYETYEEYSINREWTFILEKTAREVGIDFMSTPYDMEAVDQLFPYVPAYKIGSGDITYHQLIEAVAKTKKPVFLATGASTIEEVAAAVNKVLAHNRKLCLLQCNTNYTGDLENFKYVNLNVLRTYASLWPGLPLGLSDHTPGHSCVLGAVALGARVIEKHFTDDRTRKGPDHAFAMEPYEWQRMTFAVSNLEDALGDGIKRVEPNEEESAIVQRRAIRVKEFTDSATPLNINQLEFLRPCPHNSLGPHQVNKILGIRLWSPKKKGEAIGLFDMAGYD